MAEVDPLEEQIDTIARWIVEPRRSSASPAPGVT
jgi:hypothetical protein